MAIYHYVTIDDTGKRKQGYLEGVDRRDIESRLESQGVAILSISLNSDQKKNTTPGKRHGKVTRRELIEFCIYLGSLCEAGLSIIDALRDFSQETQNKFLKHVVETLQHTVESGQTLSDGMALFPNVFSREFLHLIKAGEQTGTLPRSLRELRAYLEWLDRVSADIKQATTYPVFVSCALGVFILYLFSSVVPKITGILVDMRLELPLITKIIMSISDVATKTWWLWLFVVFVVPLSITFIARRNEKLAVLIDRTKLSLPIFGGLIQLIIQARFTQNFAVLHRAGISILDNLHLCKGFIGNRIYARAMQRALQDVRDGGTLSQSLKNSNLFSGLVIRMVSVGEASGDMENSLKHAAAYYDEEVSRRVKKAFAVLEPLIIIVLVMIVGVVALAVFLPILSISQGMR